MSGSKTKAVGGQAVNPVAKNYQSFLGNALGQSGDFQGTLNSLLSGSNQTGFIQSLQQLQHNQSGQLDQLQTQQAQQQQQSQGQQNDFLQQLAQFQNGLTTPNNQVNLNQNVNTAIPGSVANQNPDLNLAGLAGLGQQSNLQDTSGLAHMLASLSGVVPQINYQANQNVPQVTSSSPDVNGTFANALTQNINDSINNQAGQLREGFAASGGGAGRGTPGAYAEAVLRSQAAPQIAAALGNLNLQQNAQTMQAQQANQGASLQNAGLNLQGLLGSNSLNLQGLGQVGQNLTGAAGITQGQNAQALSNQTQNRGLDVNQLQNFLASMNQTNTANQQSGLTQRAQDIGVNSGNQNALLQLLGLQNNQAQGLNQTQLAGQQNQLTGQQLQMQGQNQLAQNQLTSQQQMIQALLGGQQNQMNLLNSQGNANQLTQQGQLAALAQIFGGLNQTNQLGTTQAQSVQKPSGFQNFVSGLTGLTSAAAPIAGLFG